MVPPASHGFHVSRGTQDTQSCLQIFAYGALTLYGCTFQCLLTNPFSTHVASPTTPKSKLSGLGSSPFARHYLRNHFFFLFLRYLDVSVPCVSPSIHLCIQCNVTEYNSSWVSPFGNLRIKAYLPLPVAYRSLSRPSSAPGAKAFPLCSF